MILLCFALIGYCFYSKYAEIKQIDSISKIDGITYEELNNLIDKIKR